jgi:hypothetical protein
VIFFLPFSLVFKYVRKTVVQHKTIRRIKFVVRKQSGFLTRLIGSRDGLIIVACDFDELMNSRFAIDNW